MRNYYLVMNAILNVIYAKKIQITKIDVIFAIIIFAFQNVQLNVKIVIISYVIIVQLNAQFVKKEFVFHVQNFVLLMG